MNNRSAEHSTPIDSPFQILHSKFNPPPSLHPLLDLIDLASLHAQPIKVQDHLLPPVPQASVAGDSQARAEG